jgi:hypothetical protein
VSEKSVRDANAYRYWMGPGHDVGRLLLSMSDDELLAVARATNSEPHQRAISAALQSWSTPAANNTDWIPGLAARECFVRNLIDLQEFKERAPWMLTDKAWALSGHLRYDDLLATTSASASTVTDGSDA